MDKLISIMAKLIRDRWRRRSTLLLLILLALLILLKIFSGIDLQKITIPKIIISAIVLLILVIIWFFTTRLPKTPKDMIGFGLAIAGETTEQNKKIISDFINTLSEITQRSKFKYKYKFIIYPIFYAEKIICADDAIKYLISSRLSFLIWGRTRTRLINGEDKYVLDLQGIVRHIPIDPEFQKNFATEFTELFPNRLIISKDNDIFSFEFTAEWTHLVATYIIGTAALISGDVSYAQELFEYLKKRVNIVQTDLPAIIKLRQRIPLRLSNIYIIQSSSFLFEWENTKNPDLLLKAKSFLDKLRQVDPGNYDAHIQRSMILFVIDKDINEAKKEIQKCRTNHIDITWRYDYAFLLAYEGDLAKAHSEYKRAFHREVNPKAYCEIESFILWILDKEPDKVQLYFLLGLLYLRKLDNPSQAFEALEKFVSNAPSNIYDEQIEIAQEYLKTIKKEFVQKTSPVGI